MGFSLPSFAKINWTLRVLGKRADGFHELSTLFQTVSLCDRLYFEEADELVLTCDDPRIPTDERNLVIAAANLLRSRLSITLGARIGLEKRIPSPGGLGGGSSNAAAALIGLARLWKLDAREQLASIAAELGSDVPFFLVGGTAIGTGRGEIVEPAGDIDCPVMLIVTPRLSVSTREAFAGLDAGTLTSTAPESNLSVCRNEADSLDPLRSVLKNDFEPSVFARFPEIEKVKRTLFELGASNAALSGSGASVFAVFDKQETRQAAIDAIDRESTWARFAVSAISRRKYREALEIE